VTLRPHPSLHRRALLAAAVLAGTALLAVLPSAAQAAWRTGGDGSAGAASGTIGVGGAPDTSVAADVVTLSWVPLPLLGTSLVTDRATVVGFRQEGEDEVGPLELDSSCTDTPTTTCTHTQPVGETWRYAVIMARGGWTGPQSEPGVAVTVTPPPTGGVVFPGGGPVNATGWDGGCVAHGGPGVCGTAIPAPGGAAITHVEVRVTDPAGRSLDGEGDWVTAEVWRSVVDRTAAAAGAPAPLDWYLALPASALGPDGDYTVAVRTGDAAGWVGIAGSPGSVVVDRVAPTTTSDVPSGVQPSATTITFSATDDRSAVASTEYRTSTDGVTFTAWVAGTSVTLATAATHTVEFRSTDAAGNVESARTVTVEIDLTAPTVTLTAPDDLTTVLSRSEVTLSATASHPRFDILSVQFAWSRDGVAWTPIGPPVTDPIDGVHSVTTTSPHLPAGHLQLRATAVRTGGVDGTSATRSITVRPEIVSVVLENGGTLATADPGDRVVITFTDALDPASVCGDFTAAPGVQSRSDLTVRIAGNPRNVLTVSDAGGCGATGFGSLGLGSGGSRYTTTGPGVLTFAGSTITWDPDARQLRITLGPTQTGSARIDIVPHAVEYSPGSLTAEGVAPPDAPFTATAQVF